MQSQVILLCCLVSLAQCLVPLYPMMGYYGLHPGLHPSLYPGLYPGLSSLQSPSTQDAEDGFRLVLDLPVTSACSTEGLHPDIETECAQYFLCGGGRVGHHHYVIIIIIIIITVTGVEVHLPPRPQV